MRACCARRVFARWGLKTADEAVAAREAGEKRVILFNLSGHGHFDLGAYEQYLHGNLEDFSYPAEAVKEALAEIPKVGAE